MSCLRNGRTARCCAIVRRMIRVILGTLILAVSAWPARADELPWFQAALHGGYRAGGGLEDAETGDDRDFEEGGSFALALELRYEKGDDRFYQLWYSRQATEIDDGIETHDAD